MELSIAVFLMRQLAFEQLPKAHPNVHCTTNAHNGLTNCLLQCCRSRSDIMRDIVYDLGMRQICRKNKAHDLAHVLPTLLGHAPRDARALFDTSIPRRTPCRHATKVAANGHSATVRECKVRSPLLWPHPTAHLGDCPADGLWSANTLHKAGNQVSTPRSLRGLTANQSSLLNTPHDHMQTAPSHTFQGRLHTVCDQCGVAHLHTPWGKPQWSHSPESRVVSEGLFMLSFNGATLSTTLTSEGDAVGTNCITSGRTSSFCAISPRQRCEGGPSLETVASTMPPMERTVETADVGT